MSTIVVLRDLRGKFGAARNQGPRPTCLAFAASDTHAALRPIWSPLSCEFLFYHAQRREGRGPDVGATLSATLSALRHEGQPEELGWPYLSVVPHDPSGWLPPADVGPRFGRAGEPQAPSVGAVIAELEVGLPVILLLTLSRAFYAPNPKAIIAPSIDEIPDANRRHAVIAVGHGTVDGERAVLVRNSWGAGWGAAGYGWLTEAFLVPRLFGVARLMESVDVLAGSNAA